MANNFIFSFAIYDVTTGIELKEFRVYIDGSSSNSEFRAKNRAESSAKSVALMYTKRFFEKEYNIKETIFFALVHDGVINPDNFYNVKLKSSEIC